ncbi:hypothetical protein NEOLEDRAFT_1133381 [Neolentinus lepideus HHB14362 ss-1]|uniref:Uncharacterized protein n=1 Tax=Neolentinus lepideus HHB14362 ss-1 TaxID=1314782 RepID=A0A165SPA5_9AGAM|nr:hypothetical protein NEOLEDRAFT_1133381 [Neolentinus lepideus HHB14362 ss-1]
MIELEGQVSEEDTKLVGTGDGQEKLQLKYHGQNSNTCYGVAETILRTSPSHERFTSSIDLRLQSEKG